MFNCQKIATSAGISLYMYKHIFQNEELKESPNKILQCEQESYKGGRCEVFKKSYSGNELYYYDINSSYPSSMCDDMPFEYQKTMKYNDKKFTNINEITKYNLYLSKSIYKGNDKYFINNLLIRNKNKNIYSTKNTDYSYHWGVELIECMNNGCDIYIKEQLFYSNKKLFSEFSKYYYNERIIEKEKGNDSKQLFYKNICNSLYGKFGQKQFNNKKIIENNNEIYETIGKNKLINFEIINDKMLIEYEPNDDNYIGKLVRFSSYISACSRTKLSEQMRYIGHEHIYYCDTDSIFTSKQINKKYISKKLGDWKLEDIISKALFISPKCYYYESLDQIVKKSKGIKSDELTNTDYIECHINNKNIKQNCIRFNRSFNGITITENEINLKSIYNKRKFINDTISEAYENMEELEKTF